jgi:murein DD-endopeptidase MepM/ murein hydrolase activator NlpD
MNRKKFYRFCIAVIFMSVFFVGCTSMSETQRSNDFSSIVFEYPLRSEARFSKGFGEQPSLFSSEENATIFHPGIDLAVRSNTSVLASLGGTVTETGFDRLYGNFIRLKHEGGYETFYAHLQEVKVKSGRSVRKGSVIGKSGNTGFSTGPHLHFGIYLNGEAINPLSVSMGE